MKYVLVNWSYNKPGRWLSICSTDHATTQSISEIVCDCVKSYARIRYDFFNTHGGRATIEDIETDLQHADLNVYLADYFISHGWKGQADRREIYSFTKIS